MKIQYIEKEFKAQTLALIMRADQIIEEYMAQGYEMTLRQLYYQFVARDLLPNKDASYNRLGEAVSNGRLAGMLDWDAIKDRTRFTRGLQHWGGS